MQVPSQELAFIFSLLYHTWLTRNKQVYEAENGEELTSNVTILATSQKLVRDYREAQSHVQPTPTMRPTVNHWEGPPPGSHKVNVDGSWVDNDPFGGVGVIIGDHSGIAVASGYKRLYSAGGASTIEAAAFLYGIQMAI
ncbi:hypothetical protein HS088_TW08G00931 [Tripterygium wilfordii]|uniref:RNase H type-1 domain-containing protein n=1 Tax=Tripterygium wilfordii TaxID=458696 RepID=A0A7J7DDJ8_TRIWF|nr:hypothetical protein HS088_TW08G00931 [Tripterygium wilfordii]